MIRLAHREQVILELIAEGYETKKFLGFLRLSDSGARYHLEKIYTKLGATNRAHAVALGFRMGLLK